MNLLKKNKKII